MTPLEHAEVLMWSRELHSPDWKMRHLAAERICGLWGVADLLKAVQQAGEFTPPPHWPLVDAVPIGGAVGFLDVEVRTFHQGRIERVTLRIAPKKGVSIAEQAEAVVDRGRWELRRRLSQ